MGQVVEPLEILLVVIGAMTVFRSVEVLLRSYARYRHLKSDRRCEAILKLGWMKVRESGKDSIWCLMALFVGLSTSSLPPPISPNPYRFIFQVGWVLCAVITLATELRNESDANRVAEIIENERRRFKYPDEVTS